MFASDGGYDPGSASHAALLELRRTVERHPAVREARGEPPAAFTRVEAEIDSSLLGGDAETGSLTIRWYAGENEGARPEFAFHYSATDGFDCGWHHEPNPHVDGWGHYQERAGLDGEYDYEPVEYGSLAPARVVWEIFERLGERLGN